MDCRIFFPTSRRDFTSTLSLNQRYRYPFGDQRLANRCISLQKQFCERETSVIHQLSEERKDVAAAYRFVNNDQVGLAELIHQTTLLQEEEIRGKDLQVNLDRSSFSMNLGGYGRLNWGKEFGVLEDNRTPGFYLTPAQVLERGTQHYIGLADVLEHTRPLIKLSPKETLKVRTQRTKLPLKSKESGAWAIVASNAATQLQAAQRVTFVIDQAGDSYDVFHHILKETKRDFIIRARSNRQATLSASEISGTFSELLALQPWVDVSTVAIRPLDHYSKSSGKRVQRKKRQAQLCIRFIEVVLERPSSPPPKSIFINQTLTLVEVLEDPSTVPEGEEPIHWRLLSSWKVNKVKTAWKMVEAYQGRWHIEQLFRCCKKQGINIESSQLRKPESIMKLAIMALKASAEALRLTQVREGEQFVPIDTMFDQQKQEILKKLNAKLSGKTEKVTNPHQSDSLAWAAWIIARLGGWKGYASQRKPGPITMTKGLIRFNDLFFWNESINFSP